jgi:hypothetical protein
MVAGLRDAVNMLFAHAAAVREARSRQPTSPQRGTDVCRQLAGHFSHSVMAKEKPGRNPVNVPNTPNHRIIQDLHTRWNSYVLYGGTSAGTPQASIAFRGR